MIALIVYCVYNEKKNPSQNTFYVDTMVEYHPVLLLTLYNDSLFLLYIVSDILSLHIFLILSLKLLLNIT